MVIRIRVKSNSKENSIILKDGVYVLHTKEPAKENRANISVIKQVAEFFDVPKSTVSIKHGLKNREKIVEILN